MYFIDSHHRESFYDKITQFFSCLSNELSQSLILHRNILWLCTKKTSKKDSNFIRVGRIIKIFIDIPRNIYSLPNNV